MKLFSYTAGDAGRQNAQRRLQITGSFLFCPLCGLPSYSPGQRNTVDSTNIYSYFTSLSLSPFSDDLCIHFPFILFPCHRFLRYIWTLRYITYTMPLKQWDQIV